jgi:hypothetical protein
MYFPSHFLLLHASFKVELRMLVAFVKTLLSFSLEAGVGRI